MWEPGTPRSATSLDASGNILERTDGRKSWGRAGFLYKQRSRATFVEFLSLLVTKALWIRCLRGCVHPTRAFSKGLTTGEALGPLPSGAAILVVG